MWNKIEDIEDKYNISKFSIYTLIIKKPELRQYIKALEGVLQINDEGIDFLLKHIEKDNKNNKLLKNKEAISNKNIDTENLFNVIDKDQEDLLKKAVSEKKEESTISKTEPVVEVKEKENYKRIWYKNNERYISFCKNTKQSIFCPRNKNNYMHKIHVVVFIIFE